MPQFPSPDSYIDAHCHLSLPSLQAGVAGLFQRAEEKNVRAFLLAGLGPEDWTEQKNFCAQYAKKDRAIYPCFGLHPYWVAEHSRENCEKALAILASSLAESLAMGEMGLDYREEILAKGSGGREQQRHFFQAQLTLALQKDKVPVLHLVRCHDEALRILKPLAASMRPALVHAFNSGPTQAEAYLNLGFMLSVGGPLLRANNRALQETVKMVPMRQLLVESDSPDQAPPQLKGQNNEPWTILLVAERIAELKGLPIEEVLGATQKNFQRLFAKELL